MTTAWGSAWESVSRWWTEQREVSERISLLERPWEEQYLHWAWERGEWVLHGELAPPRGRMSVTRGGWCRRAAGRSLPHPRR